MMTQQATPFRQPNNNPETMSPTEQVAFYQEQARLCAAHAAHHAGQAKLHAEYVEQLISFHGLSSPVQVPVQAAEPPGIHLAFSHGREQEAAPPAGFHSAPMVDVPSSDLGAATVRFDQKQMSRMLAAATPDVAAPAESGAVALSPGSFATPPSNFAAPPSHAPSLAPAPSAQGPAAAATPSAPEAAPKASVNRALGASLVGVLMGAAIWGGVGFLTGGWEFKYGAVLIGFIVGGLALKGAGAPSKAVGIAAGVMSLVSLLLGKVAFEVLVHPSFTMGEHIAYHTTVIDLIFYGATVATGFFVASTAGAVAKVKARLGRHVPALR